MKTESTNENKVCYDELERMYFETKRELEDIKFEIEMYKQNSRELRVKNGSLKQEREHYAKENEKTFIFLCDRLFKNFWRKYPATGKGGKHRVVRDWHDGMLGIVVEGFGSSIITCYMEDESERRIDTYTKDWIDIH